MGCRPRDSPLNHTYGLSIPERTRAPESVVSKCERARLPPNAARARGQAGACLLFAPNPSAIRASFRPLAIRDKTAPWFDPGRG